MAGTILDRQLTGTSGRGVRFAIAAPEDDPAIRRLLRENPLRGAVSLSFEREPNYFHSAAMAASQDETILAFERGRIICMGRCSLWPRYINGDIRRVAYLGDLRLDASVQGRYDILRRGYQFFAGLNRRAAAEFYFTSLAADNHRSIRFLERGLPGMPSYEFVADFVTLLLSVPRGEAASRRSNARAQDALRCDGVQLVAGSREWLPKITHCLNECGRHYQCAVSWTEESLCSLSRHGLPLSDFLVLLDGTKVAACAALWDQRQFKQTVIRGYGLKTRLSRPFVNLMAAVFGTPHLPKVGATLAHAFLSPLAARETPQVEALIAGALSTAARRHIEHVTLGFAATDPRLASIREKFRCREYLSRLYRLHWDGLESGELALSDSNHLGPEVALL